MLAEIAQYTPRTKDATPAPLPALTVAPRSPRLTRARFHKPRRELDHMLQTHYDADYRLRARKQASKRLPGFVALAPLLVARHEWEFGMHLQRAIQEGVSKLVLEVDIPTNAQDGETTRTRRIYACTPDYDAYAITQDMDAGSSGSYRIVAEPFVTREDALAEIARRRPTLPRGVRLNIVGLYAGRRNDSTDLLQYNVSRY